MYRKQCNKLQRAAAQPAAAPAITSAAKVSAPVSAAMLRALRAGPEAAAATAVETSAPLRSVKNTGKAVGQAALQQYLQQQQQQQISSLQGPGAMPSRLKGRGTSKSSSSGRYKQRLHGPARRLIRHGDQLYVVDNRTLTRGGGAMKTATAAANGGVSKAKVRVIRMCVAMREVFPACCITQGHPGGPSDMCRQ
jgi:hypothetical protein